MSEFYMKVAAVSRGKSQSVTELAHYISGERLHDEYYGETYYRRRDDVLYCKVFLPDGAPQGFQCLQHLCNEIERAEKRYDARTARGFIAALPNELPVGELIQIVDEFIYKSFVDYGLCAIAAIHEGRNEADSSRNNPHVHMIVPTRPVGPDGFSAKKDREHDKREYIDIWREEWAAIQNRAYERSGLEIRVSHESLEVQGVYVREPIPRLNRLDYWREERGERTAAGDKRRAVMERNEARARRQQKKEHTMDMEKSR